MRDVIKKRFRKAAALLLIIFLSILFFFMILSFPRIPDDLNEIALSNPTYIYSDDGQIVKILANRQVVRLDHMSPDLIAAVLTLEDSDFYRHPGIDKTALMRAFVKNLIRLRIREGGSTITQQLAKNLFFGFDRSWWRKIKETFVALQIERQFTKDQILEAYLNQIDFGSGIYGVELGAQIYFSKSAGELTLAEAALLAGIPRWPARYNPYQHEDIARERQKFVLKRMVEEGYIAEEQGVQAVSQELLFQRSDRLQGHTDYFIEEIKKRTSSKYGNDAVNYGGLHIHSTLNLKYQYEANRAVQEGLARLDDILGLPSYNDVSWEEKRQHPQAALVALDTKSGAVKALVGGRDFRRAPFDRATSNNRHAGSSFKPFIYFTVLDKRIASPIMVFVDEPVAFKWDRRTYSPENYDRKYRGPMILKYALSHSINVISAKLIYKATPEAVVNCAHRLGIESTIEPNLALALGSTGVSPLEMAAALGTISNGGVRHRTFMIKEIRTKEEQSLEKYIPLSQRVADPRICYLIVDMMKSVIQDGTGKAVRLLGFNQPCAGKTGTSSEYRDAWFVGYTPDLVVVVWVGFDDNRSMLDRGGKGITGARAALPIWTLFMRRIYEGRTVSDFDIPYGIKFVQVDPRTGAGQMPDMPYMNSAILDE